VSILAVVGIFVQTVSLLSNTPQRELEEFAHRVTKDLLDTSSTRYSIGTAALTNPTNGELDAKVIRTLRNKGILPRHDAEMQEIAKGFTTSERVCKVNIESTRIGKLDSRGLIPISVSGDIAVKEKGVSEGSQPFHLQYEVGYRRFPDGLLVVDLIDN
jgi:hypothetical protein